MSFASRVAAVAVAGTLAGALATGLLMAGVADSVSDSSGETTRTFGLATLRDLVETSGQLGLELSGMAGLQTVIERDKVQDPTILSIDIVGRDGRIVYSTDSAGIGLPVPKIWTEHTAAMANQKEDRAASFQIVTRNEIVRGAVVLDNIGQPLATVVVTATQELASRRRDLERRVGLVAAGSGLIAAVLAALGAAALARSVGRDLKLASDILAHKAPAIGMPGGLAEVTAAANAVWDGAETALNGAFRELESLDEAI